ncbi:MAG: aminotransferase class III-fold pyridoxal phosphate-dependent enzyme [Frankiales bacterium]|nr:aminotransferase class III-fold pyridoxal phosphate-dependent enzyme [Frankiales bacterium]
MAGSGTVGPSSYFDPARVGELDARTADLVRRRIAALGPAYRLFYEQPLEIVRGEGVHLYDAAGQEYLDVYNNVPSLGHAHPRVAAAICAQASVLSTHTRYLHPAVVAYAEDLLSTFPAELGHVMFTCTGSEAGDLALRIAKAHTGGTGVVVTRNAYHGVTTEIAAISPSLGGLGSLPDWVRWVPAPDAFRVDHAAQGFAGLGEWFAAQVQAAIDDLAAHGIRFAAFVADSVFASDGVLTDPAGFLAPVREVVARAGGVYVADEVQPGFGRTGEALWGFARHGLAEGPLAPDIVTLGKPMGNGMPIAATVVRPEVIERFGREMRYFNTFGGNAMAIAAAQAVLDALREEGLQDNALVVGRHTVELLRELAGRHPAIGDVRGAGLFVGVELTVPGTEREPDEALTLGVVNGLRRRRVLLGTAGVDNNILKVRPPLVFSRADAERFVAELDATLTELGA